MAKIGEIDIKFAADVSGLAKGTKDGEGFIDSFTGTITKSVDKSLGSLTLLGGGAVGVGVFMGNMATMAVSAIADMVKGFINLGIESGKAIVGMIKDGLELADSLNDQSAKINSSLESYSLLRYQVKLLGGEMEAIIPSLIKLSKNIAEGSHKGTINDILKLDNNVLASMDDGIAQLVELKKGIDALPTHGAKLATAMELAGKGASGILPFLLADQEQLDKLEKRAKELNAVFSSLDADRIGVANDKLDDMDFAMKGLKVILAGEIAPLITAAIEDFIKWGKSMGDFRTIAKDALDYLAFGLDVAINFGNGLFGVLALLSTPILAFATGVTFLVEVVLHALALIPLLGKSFKGVADGATQARKDIAAFSNGTIKAGMKALDSGIGSGQGSNISGWLGDVKTKADQLDKSLGKVKLSAEDLAKVEFGKDLFKVSDKLEFDIDVHGLDETQKKIAEMLKTAGLDYKKFFKPDSSEEGNWLFGPDFKKKIDEYKAKVTELEKLDFGKKRMEEFQAVGKKAFEDTQLPIEKLISELAKLREAFGEGAVENESYRRQQIKLKKEFLEGLGVEVESPFDKIKKDMAQLVEMKSKLGLSDKEFDKAQKDIQKGFGSKLGIDFETPFEKYRKDLEDLQKAFDNKQITSEQLRMGTQQLNKKFNGGPMFTESADFGTQAARDVTLKQLFGTEQKDPIEKVAEINRDQLTEMRQIKDVLAKWTPQRPAVASF